MRKKSQIHKARRRRKKSQIDIAAVNEAGRRIGESHPNAVLTDHEVELLLVLREEGWSYGALAKKFEVSKGAVRDICLGRSRCQTAVGFKRVGV